MKMNYSIAFIVFTLSCAVSYFFSDAPFFLGKVIILSATGLLIGYSIQVVYHIAIYLYLKYKKKEPRYEEVLILFAYNIFELLLVTVILSVIVMTTNQYANSILNIGAYSSIGIILYMLWCWFYNGRW